MAYMTSKICVSVTIHGMERVSRNMRLEQTTFMACSVDGGKKVKGGN